MEHLAAALLAASLLLVGGLLIFGVGQAVGRWTDRHQEAAEVIGWFMLASAVVHTLLI